jgi:hypothetical protein
MALYRLGGRLKAEKAVLEGVENGRAYIDIDDLRIVLNEAETDRLYLVLGAAVEEFKATQK